MLSDCVSFLFILIFFRSNFKALIGGGFIIFDFYFILFSELFALLLLCSFFLDVFIFLIFFLFVHIFSSRPVLYVILCHVHMVQNSVR